MIPIAFSLWLSLYRWDMMRPNRTFIGGENFQRLLADDAFWNALRNTFLYAIGTVPASIALAFGAALLLNRKLGGRAFFRTAFFAPVVTSTVALSFVWSSVRVTFQNAIGDNLDLSVASLPYADVPATGVGGHSLIAIDTGDEAREEATTTLIQRLTSIEITVQTDCANDL